jgi:hypothetical protein
VDSLCWNPMRTVDLSVVALKNDIFRLVMVPQG